jgi:hypothetical protein
MTKNYTNWLRNITAPACLAMVIFTTSSNVALAEQKINQ